MAVQNADLRRAATILGEYADLLSQSYTVSGQWPPDAESQNVRAECQEYRALSRRLRRRAQT